MNERLSKQMTKWIFAVGALMAVTSVATAETLKEDALVCISQRKLVRYIHLEQEGNADFLKQMQRRAECVIIADPLEIAVLGKVGDYLHFERLDGMKLWGRVADLRKAETIAE